MTKHWMHAHIELHDHNNTQHPHTFVQWRDGKSILCQLRCLRIKELHKHIICMFVDASIRSPCSAPAQAKTATTSHRRLAVSQLCFVSVECTRRSRFLHSQFEIMLRTHNLKAVHHAVGTAQLYPTRSLRIPLRLIIVDV